MKLFFGFYVLEETENDANVQMGMFGEQYEHEIAGFYQDENGLVQRMYVF